MSVVAPHGGAWIEMLWALRSPRPIPSPLTEGRGLKSGRGGRACGGARVAPHGGAWIEIRLINPPNGIIRVAPHGGAWIEM